MPLGMMFYTADRYYRQCFIQTETFVCLNITQPYEQSRYSIYNNYYYELFIKFGFSHLAKPRKPSRKLTLISNKVSMKKVRTRSARIQQLHSD